MYFNFIRGLVTMCFGKMLGWRTDGILHKLCDSHSLWESPLRLPKPDMALFLLPHTFPSHSGDGVRNWKHKKVKIMGWDKKLFTGNSNKTRKLKVIATRPITKVYRENGSHSKMLTAGPNPTGLQTYFPNWKKVNISSAKWEKVPFFCPGNSVRLYWMTLGS